MKYRIMIEIESDDNTIEEMSRKIEAAAYGNGTAYADLLSGFSIKTEILPEKTSGELKVPSFLIDRPFDCRRKDCKDRIYTKGDGV